jgi:hypothetical protein
MAAKKGSAKKKAAKRAPVKKAAVMKMAAASAGGNRITATGFQVLINQNWNGRTDEIDILATDGNQKYQYIYDPANPNLPLAKALLQSIAANSGQLPWSFVASGNQITGT